MTNPTTTRLAKLLAELINLRANLDAGNTPSYHSAICNTIRSRLVPIQGVCSMLTSISNHWGAESDTFPHTKLLDFLIERIQNHPQQVILDSRKWFCLPNYLRWAEGVIEFQAHTPRNNIALVSLPRNVAFDPMRLSDYLCLVDTLFENVRDTSEGNGTKYEQEYSAELDYLEFPKDWRTDDLREDVLVHIHSWSRDLGMKQYRVDFQWREADYGQFKRGWHIDYSFIEANSEAEACELFKSGWTSNNELRISSITKCGTQE